MVDSNEKIIKTIQIMLAIYIHLENMNIMHIIDFSLIPPNY